MDTDAIGRLLLQAAFGVVGGNIVGNLAKRYDLGVLGNSIAGIIGGGLGCQVLALLLGSGSHAAGPALGGQLMALLREASGATSAGIGRGGHDFSSTIAQMVGGAVSGGLAMLIVGFGRQATSDSD
jgi:hypothetical protein